MKQPMIQAFIDSTTATISYVIYDDIGGSCAIIDSVLDYDPNSGKTSTANADKIATFIKEHKLTVTWLLETHAHADHLSAAPYLRDLFGGQIAISHRIKEVQSIFKSVFNLDKTFLPDGSQFDYLIMEDESLLIGDLSLKAIAVPGHTPADLAYQIGQNIFVGDSLFMPDIGTARCDFPGGDAKTLFQSIRKLLAFPSNTKLFMCHDYPPVTRDVQFISTVAQQKAMNIHVKDGVTESEFIALREARDKTLPVPKLLLPSIQVNIRGGHFPPAEDNGVTYLKIPITHLAIK